MKSSEPRLEQGRSPRSIDRPAPWSGYWSVCTLLLTGVLAAVAAAEDPGDPEAGTHSPRLKFDRARPVNGTLFISGGGSLPQSSLEAFVHHGGGENCRLVVVTTASETADTPEIEPRIAIFRTLKIQELCFVHTRERDVADSEEFCLPLEQATAVWFIGGHQSRLTETYLDTRFERCLRKVLERGGVIGGTSAGAAIMSEVMIKGGNPEPELDRGFGFLPGTVVDQHFIKRRRMDRLMNALAGYPELVGLGIDEGTTLVVQGRKMTVLDESDSLVTACLAATEQRPLWTDLLSAGREVDLIALARSAARRINPKVFTDEPLNKVGLGQGTVVAVGGGDVPPKAAECFVEAAGGGQALILVITTAFGEHPPDEDESIRWLREAGAQNTVCLHVRNQSEAAQQRTIELIQQAGGVWFTGGRQWRIIDAIEDSPLEPELRSVLARGGAVGGNAAGASVLASFLVRGSPLNNSEISCQGYEDGFGLLPGTAIDAYFSSRKRQADMAQLKRTHKHLLGLGIDESTAVVIRGTELTVHGFNQVAVFDDVKKEQQSETDFTRLYPGDTYDLVTRTRVSADEHEDEDETPTFVVSVDDPEEDDETPSAVFPPTCE